MYRTCCSLSTVSPTPELSTPPSAVATPPSAAAIPAPGARADVTYRDNYYSRQSTTHITMATSQWCERRPGRWPHRMPGGGLEAAGQWPAARTPGRRLSPGLEGVEYDDRVQSHTHSPGCISGRTASSMSPELSDLVSSPWWRERDSRDTVPSQLSRQVCKVLQ